MSLLAETETVSKIANFTGRILNQGFNSFGFEAQKDVFDAFKECLDSYGFYNADKIYKSLYKLLFTAYNSRYKDDFQDWETNQELYKNPDIDIWEYRYVENGNELAQCWHYEMLKHLQFVFYQLNESATFDNPITIAINSLINTLSMFIACHNVVYHSYAWE